MIHERDPAADGPSWDDAERVIEQYGKAVFAAACRHARSYHDAEDIYGEVMREFCQAFHRGTITGDLRAFLFSRVAFRAASHYRKKSANEVAVGDDLLDVIHNRPGALLDEDAALHRGLSREVVAALRRLDSEERGIIVLRTVYDLTNDQAAAVLGLPPRTAKRRYATGLRRLRDLLSGYGPPSEQPTTKDDDMSFDDENHNKTEEGSS